MPRRKYYSQRGFEPLSTLIILAIVFVSVAYALLTLGIIENPLEKKVKVALSKQYENPFDKETQYVNPFAVYKNPFDSLQ